LTAKELSERTGVSRQTTYHLLHTLREAGYLERGPGMRYQLGYATRSLAYGETAPTGFPEAVTRLEKLAQRTRESCTLSCWQGDDVVVVAQVPGIHAVRVADVHPGQRGHLHARASGKLLLAYASPERRRRVMAGLELVRLTEKTLTRGRALERELARTRSLGYATDIEEFAEGISCVAGRAVTAGTELAFAVLAPSWRFDENFDDYVDAVLEMASSPSTRDRLEA
jgi:DNA-binding IclR family transcriptional regulator